MFNLGKVCTKCKEKKPMDEFHNRKSEKDGKSRYCKKCKRTKNRESKLKKNNKIGFDSKHYTDKLIDYEGKKAYIGINKEPLMKNEDGYGFQGVLLQDEKRRLVQCAACGEWFQFVNKSHLKSCCNLTPKEYKKKYGLNQTQGLVSDAEALRRKKNMMLNIRNNHKGYIPSNIRRGINSRGKELSMQYRNSKGTCPEQLKARIKEFINGNHELPSYKNRGARLAATLRYRYGSLNKAFEKFSLPTKHRTGAITIYKFPDGDTLRVNSRSWYDKEIIYNKILSKCPEFREYVENQ